MNWIAWIAEKHALIVHIPIAAALLIPLPIIAAQRGGRGIRPWWVTCRYLAWAGAIGSLCAMVSGLCLAHQNGMLPEGALFPPNAPGLAYLLRIHEGGGALALVLGALCIRSLYRKRQEHQGIGVPALLAGLAWCIVAGLSTYSGSILTGQRPAPRFFLVPPSLPSKAEKVAAAPMPAPVALPSMAGDPEAKAPYRALDFLALRAQHAEPVKSGPHGNRWVRVWVSPEAEAAYKAGGQLPLGSLVVMSTQEDRWGRPGPDAGPLYALEIAKEGPRLTFYWPQVPEARRAEAQGEASAYWRGSDARIQACMACHAQGLAALKDRSKWLVPHKPKPTATTTATPTATKAGAAPARAGTAPTKAAAATAAP